MEWKKFLPFLFCSALWAAPQASTGGAGVRVAPAPAGEALSEDYALSVNGVEVPVYACRVSAMPMNQVWPGYQRPLEQTELAGFAYWDMGKPVRIEIDSRRPVQTAVVKPGHLKLAPKISGNRISFDLDRPRPLVVEVNGMHHALHLFASPPETNVPDPAAPGVRHFGPGVHRVGRLALQSRERVYLAAGAVVYGSLQATGAEGLRIAGRGILDVSPYERGKGGGAVQLIDCKDAVIDGIIMRDPDEWCCHAVGCQDLLIQNVKLIGLWRYNTDGIDICNSQRVRVRDSFVRAFDDALVVKGVNWHGDAITARSPRDIRFSQCTLWCDWDVAIKIGTESYSPEIAGIVFEDCDILRTSISALGILPNDVSAIHDIRFEDIRIEMDGPQFPPRFQKERGETYDPGPGNYLPKCFQASIGSRKNASGPRHSSISNILLRNISITAPDMPASSLSGFDVEYGISGVVFEALRLNGRTLGDATGANLAIKKYVGEVQIREEAGKD